jgi:hypothetical protein
MPEPEKKKGFTLTKTQTIVSLICGLFVIIGTSYGVFNSYDSSLVHMTEYTAFKQQVNEATLQQRIDFYQRIVWDLETIYKTNDPLKMDHDTEKYRTAAKNLDVATKQLEVIQDPKDKP